MCQDSDSHYYHPILDISSIFSLSLIHSLTRSHLHLGVTKPNRFVRSECLLKLPRRGLFIGLKWWQEKLWVHLAHPQELGLLVAVFLTAIEHTPWPHACNGWEAQIIFESKYQGREVEVRLCLYFRVARSHIVCRLSHISLTGIIRLEDVMWWCHMERGRVCVWGFGGCTWIEKGGVAQYTQFICNASAASSCLFLLPFLSFWISYFSYC